MMDIKGVKDISNVMELDAIDLKIEAGEFIALMGPSGSGKSTLLNIVGCLDRPTSGRFVLQGQDVSQISDDELVRLRRAAPGSARAQLRGHPARSDCRRRASPASSLARGILLSTLTSLVVDNGA
jgi:energy-coupling factor transporter ATP-binding protein EcfA2